MESLKEIRVSKNLTQQLAAVSLGVSLRSYDTYENDKPKIGSLNYRYIVDSLNIYITTL